MMPAATERRMNEQRSGNQAGKNRAHLYSNLRRANRT
jgi:hypothetical protein